MIAATLVSIEEYLSTNYDPDCDYVDGELLERNVGEMDHGDAQSCFLVYVRTHCPGYWAVVEVRAQVRANRFLVPDVTIVRGGKTRGRMFTEPPEVAVEVLSPEDRVSALQQRIDDYLAFGIPAVWVVDPETRRGFIHTADGVREAKDGVLRSADGALAVPLAAIFGE